MESKGAPQTLKRRSEFLRILKLGRKQKASQWLTAAYLKTESGQLRVGWTIPKQVGKAVLRNRLKRLMRESLKKIRTPQQFLGADINMIFRSSAREMIEKVDYEQMKQVFQKVINDVVKQNSRID